MFAFRTPSWSKLRSAFVRFQSTTATPPRASRLPLVAGVGAASFALGWYGPQVSTSDSKAGSNALAIKNSGTPPVLDTTAGYPFSPPKPLSPAEVTAILNQHAWSVTLPSKDAGGITRYDGAQVASNSPCEDRYIHGRFPSPASGKDWFAFGVFDGHLGGQTSTALTRHLIPYVHRALAQAKSLATDDAVHAAVASAFCALVDAFVLGAEATMDDQCLSWAEKLLRLTPGTNGSCALLALYDTANRKLHVACTGDSRAVMGRYDPTTQKWEVVPLSTDQGGRNESEKSRIASEHPGEDVDKLVKDGRVLGLATMRAFGDAHWKWDLETLARGKKEYLADTLRPHDPEVYKTPPYVIAKPEVTTTEVGTPTKAFMIMASDGLWDVLTNEQAVGLVGKWLEWEATGRPTPPPTETEQGKFGRFDWSVQRKNGWRMTDDKFTVRDGNVAVHLVRNALGGAHHDMVSGLLGLKGPFVRYGRDDITVQVVFF